MFLYQIKKPKMEICCVGTCVLCGNLYDFRSPGVESRRKREEPDILKGGVWDIGGGSSGGIAKESGWGQTQ